MNIQPLGENKMLEDMTDLQKMACSIDEVSRQTSLSKPFLRLEIKRGRLNAKHFGRRVLVLNQDLKNYLNKAEQTTQGGENELIK
jgi:excisionase family DNA binding protein